MYDNLDEKVRAGLNAGYDSVKSVSRCETFGTYLAMYGQRHGLSNI